MECKPIDKGVGASTVTMHQSVDKFVSWGRFLIGNFSTYSNKSGFYRVKLFQIGCQFTDAAIFNEE